ncbi:MAG: bifunctional hydroxymethylpyrimidine kinase/phosphomethylpyrimidine kinase [Kiritimatiellae bacterium]|nr:bifunctional hydroxymethylpyrimidine kinase/phosphomethylpyrimidine kinase [Kiritimatiellia bacterium]
MRGKKNIPLVLTIAGSDSGGGAGIQADLRTFADFNVAGASAITCLTAQNPHEISAVQPASPAMVTAQISAVCGYFPVAGVKTGMLCNRRIAAAAAREIKRRKFKFIVVDPVCRATSGRPLLTKDGFNLLCTELFPRATVITPNIPEAEMILNRRILTYADQRAAALELSGKFGSACIIKGGHMPGEEIADVFCRNNRLYSFWSRRMHKSLHGSGCIYAAAVAACLARGLGLKSAANIARKYIVKMIMARGQ